MRRIGNGRLDPSDLEGKIVDSGGSRDGRRQANYGAIRQSAELAFLDKDIIVSGPLGPDKNCLIWGALAPLMKCRNPLQNIVSIKQNVRYVQFIFRVQSFPKCSSASTLLSN